MILDKKILISLNRNVFNEYRKEYFKQNPRARVFPFDTKGKTKKVRYSVLSLNDLLPITSMMYSSQKEKWGDFGKWVAKKHGLSDKQFTNSMIELRVFSETKAQKDCDNIAGGYKVFGDGLIVQSGMFVDDNYNHINPLLIICDYDKENPRFEIRISLIEDNIKDPYEKLIIHLNNWNEKYLVDII